MSETFLEDLYPKELSPLVNIEGTEAIPIQSTSIVSEDTESVFHVTPNTILSWLSSFLQRRIRPIVTKSTNWTVLTTESSVIYVVTASVGSTVTCTIPANLPIGFEFEVEDTNGITVVFSPSATERFRNLSNGVSVSTQNSGTDPFRRITIRKLTSSIWNLHMDSSAIITV
jgi:hypothetical protein